MASNKPYPESFSTDSEINEESVTEIEDVYNGPDIEAVYAGPNMWDDNRIQGIVVNDGSSAGVIKEGAELVKEIAEDTI